MTLFTYTFDPPFEDPKENRRAFYRLPRSILLPPYLESNPYFVQFCDALDEVFDSKIEGPTFALQNIRDVWATNKTTEEKIKNGEMLSFSDWGGVDHATNVQQTNHLGLKISTAEAIDDQGYRALSKFIGNYWFGKGKKSAVDFLNFCLGTNISVIPLWTKDYVTFAPYPGDGQPFIFDPSRHTASDYYPQTKHSKVGGWSVPGYTSKVGSTLQQYVVPTVTPDVDAWYPTTHVELRVPQGTAVSSEVIGRLFYEIANYNLVIHAINVETNTQSIVTDGGTEANVMAMATINDTLISPSTPYYPIAYHNRVGGRTGGVGSKLRHIDSTEWIL